MRDANFKRLFCLRCVNFGIVVFLFVFLYPFVLFICMCVRVYSVSSLLLSVTPRETMKRLKCFTACCLSSWGNCSGQFYLSGTKTLGDEGDEQLRELCEWQSSRGKISCGGLWASTGNESANRRSGRKKKKWIWGDMTESDSPLFIKTYLKTSIHRGGLTRVGTDRDV